MLTLTLYIYIYIHAYRQICKWYSCLFLSIFAFLPKWSKIPYPHLRREKLTIFQTHFSLFSKPSLRSREGLFWRTWIYGTSRWCWYPAIVGSDSWDLNLSQKFGLRCQKQDLIMVFCWKFTMLLFWKLANCWGIFLNAQSFCLWVCFFRRFIIWSLGQTLLVIGPPFPNLLTNTTPTAWPPFQRLPETKNRLRIRTVGLEKTTRFYQASTSELYGMVQEVPQKASWCRTMDKFGLAWVVDFSGWVIFQKIYLIFTPNYWGRWFSFWRYNIFQMGWFNHQPDGKQWKDQSVVHFFLK